MGLQGTQNNSLSILLKSYWNGEKGAEGDIKNLSFNSFKVLLEHVFSLMKTKSVFFFQFF